MTANDIDGYLESVEEPKRSTLEEMRRRILEVIPDAERCLSYAVPAFQGARQDDRGVGRVQEPSELPATQRLGPFGPRRGNPRLHTDRRILHFPVDTPLPRPLLKKLLTTRMRQAGLGAP